MSIVGKHHEDKRHGLSPGGAAHRSLSRQPSAAHRLPQRPPLGVVAAATAARQRRVFVAMETEKPREIRRRQRSLSQYDGVKRNFSVAERDAADVG